MESYKEHIQSTIKEKTDIMVAKLKGNGYNGLAEEHERACREVCDQLDRVYDDAWKWQMLTYHLNVKEQMIMERMKTEDNEITKFMMGASLDDVRNMKNFIKRVTE